MQDKLSFNSHFLNHILLNCIINTDFAKKIITVIDPKIFKTQEKQFIFNIIKDYVIEFKECPADHFFDLFDERKNELSDKKQENCIEIINSIKQINHSNPEYVLSKIHKAISYFEFSDALARSAQLHKMGNEAEAKSIILKALKKPEELKNTYYDFLKDKSYIENRSQGKSYKMKTLIKEIDQLIGGFNPTWLITILGASKCFKFDTLINLPSGELKTIEQIIKDKDKKILTYENGKFKEGKIINYFNNGIKECYKLITKTGREIEVTKNHPFLTLDGWKNLNELNINDYIFVPKRLSFFGTNELPDYKLKLLGYLLADGGLTVNTITFEKNNKKISKDFIKCVESIGDKIFLNKNNTTFLITKGYISPKATETRKWLKEIGLKNEKSKEKFIPNIIFTLKKENICLFLSTLFTCDGYITKSKEGKIEIGYCSTSKKLIYGVGSLLTKFGILYKIEKRLHSNFENYVFYTLIISDKKNCMKFIKKIGFTFDKKTKSQKLLSILDKRKSNRRFIDSFPYEYSLIIKEEIRNFIKVNGKQNRKWWQQLPLRNLAQALRRKTGISIDTINKIGQIINNKKLINWKYVDISIDQIKSIVYTGKFQTYDIEVEKTHNLIGNNILTHNSGKTFWLIELAVAALIQGLNVLFISLEMSKIEIDNRFDMVIGFLGDRPGEAIETMQYKKGEWVKVEMIVPTIYDLDKVAKNRIALAKRGGKIIIADRTGGEFNYHDLELLQDQIEEDKGILFDVVITDYLGEMGSTEKNQKKKERISANASGLKGMAKERNQIHITGGQGNRKAMQSKTFQSHMISDDIYPVFVSDLIAAICQTEKEEKASQYRWYVADYRHGPKHESISLVKDLKRGQIALGKGKDIKIEDDDKNEIGEDY